MSMTTERVKISVDVREEVIKWGLRALAVLTFLILWEWYGNQPDTFAIAPPSEVFAELWEVISSGVILKAIAGTLGTAVVGYVISVVLGVALGLIIAVSIWARNTIEPIINALYAAPLSMLIPILGVYIGLGFRGRVVLVVLWAVFVIIINTSTGIREVSPSLIEMAQAFCLNRWGTYRKVILPAALPSILVGLRLGAGRALRGAITAELLLIVVNMGRFLIGAGSTFNMPRLLAGIVFVVFVGLLVIQGAEYLEDRIMSWRHM